MCYSGHPAGNMACHAIHSWTFLGIVGAFVDLAIAYVLLCCSFIAFFISKFLGFFGLTFPCPCNNLFGNSNAFPCLQKLLVDLPTDKIFSIQLSVKRKFPFGSLWAWNDECLMHFKVVSERKLASGIVELEGEASCSSFSVSDAKKYEAVPVSNLVSKNKVFAGAKDSRLDVKGKEVVPHRQSSGIRGQCRSSADISKLALCSSCDSTRSAAQVVSLPRFGNSKTGNGIISNNTIDANEKVEPLPVAEMEAKFCSDLEPKYPALETKAMDKDAASIQSVISNSRCQSLVHAHEENAITILEQALEKEQAAQTALCYELENERIAAATAADEAMAMISRLQEEKAAIELEARQYQRILEEKSAYDCEEMNILKEIIVRREWEKHFLEKEVESYKKMLLESEQLEGDAYDITYDSAPLAPREDQTSIVCQPSGSMWHGERIQDERNLPDYASPSIENDRELSAVSQYNLHHTDVSSQEFQEKGIMEQIQNDNLHSLENGSLSTTKSCDTSGMSDQDDQRGMDLQSKDTNPKEQHVYDVHVVDDTSSCATASSPEMDQEISRSSSDMFSALQPLSRSNSRHRSEPSELRQHSLSEFDHSSSLEMDQDISGSSLDMFSAFPPLSRSNSSHRSKPSELRRHSMSAIDHEKVKINKEVGWLRERLRNIRAGREKLHISLEHLEKGKSQLILLEDIASLLREISQLTEPQKAMRRTSLPPQPSKATSRKRRSKGSPVGVCLSS